MKIILASTSPRRKQILEKIGLDFEIVGSDYEEDMTLPLSPMELAAHLSLGKAQAVAKKYDDALIIAADCIVACDHLVLGKPESAEMAKKYLRMLSGRSHSVITGFTIIDAKSKNTVSRSQETKVYIKKLSDEEIDNYIKTGEPMDKAGAYAAQELGSMFVEKIDGDFFNVMGLPIFSLVEELKKFGVDIWN